MTKAKLVFDPFSLDFFNGPYKTYRRMREEAPVYYSEEYDFYALTRHEDVAAAYKDFQTYSSAHGCDLAMIRRGLPAEQKSIIFMDPPEHRHMRSLVNKVFTPRAIAALKPMVAEVIDHFFSVLDPAGFDAVQDFSGPFPVEVITRMLGVPEEHRQKVRHLIDTTLHREPGQLDIDEAGWQASVQTGMLYYNLIQQRRAGPQDDMITRLIAAEVECEGGETRRLDDIEIAGFATLLGGAGAETVTKLVGNAVALFARYPEQWRKAHRPTRRLTATAGSR